jgi:thermitase
VRGADFVDGDGDPDDYQFHGSHVAGTAAAADGNGQGTAGVAPDARLMAVRVLDGDGSGSSTSIGNGIAYAALESAGVINLSLGGPAGADDQFLSDAVELARQRNAVVVAAAGNSGENSDVFPTTPCVLPQPNLICVAAIDPAGGLAGFSNYGAASVDVGAPGVDILSTKTDWGPPVLSDNFNGTLAAWDFFTAPTGFAWGQSGVASEGQSVTDSPGGNYANDSDSEIFTASPVDLSGQRGCRMHFDLSHDIEDPGPNGFFDALLAGAVTDSPNVDQLLPFAGDSDGFFGAEVSISDLDDRADVFPIFALLSDESVTADGAYVDGLRLFCRDQSYVNAVTTVASYDQAASGNYVAFDGTSMAAPHVAGVAALVRAADPGASAEQVVEAIKQGAAPLASLAGLTLTGGTADADAAIRTALATPNPPPAGGGGGGGGTVPAGPSAASLRGAKGRIRVSRSGVFTYPIRAAGGLRGTAVFRTRTKAIVSRRAHLTLARKGFTVPGAGRVTLRVKLARKKLRVLRRNGRLLLRVTVTVRDSAGRSATSSRTMTLLAPRRR